MGSILVGAMALGAMLTAVGALIEPPATAVVTLVVGLAVAAAIGLRPPSGPWRVPRGWSQAGDTGYAALFGLVLGFGVLTTIPTFGFLALMIWTATSDWQTSLPIFVAFALARSLPLIAASFRSTAEGVTDLAAHARRMARFSRPFDAALLAGIAVALVAS